MLLITMNGCRMLRPNPAEVMFKANDANGDGQVSKAEWDLAMQKRFETMDTDHNGIISATEMDAAKGTMKARFKSLRSGE
jgi:Ca2+-binding EF-hand superfamily protein